MADEPQKWIQNAVSNPGGLHRALNVAPGKDIPMDKIREAANSNDPHLAKMARFALTMHKLNG